MNIHDIALTMQPTIGARAAAHLIERFLTAENIFGATAGELVEKAELRPDIARAITKKTYHTQAEKELRHCERHGITPIAATDPQYPALLGECGDHPHVIYFRGDPEVLRRQMLSTVGTRNITSYGQKMCDRLIGELAALRPGVAIVSGLAYGVDGACHRAALATGLPTLGVLATPLHNVTPAAHARMAEEMAQRGGGLISEYHSAAVCTPACFVERNRIIAGLAEGTVVVESGARGGSMSTARMADGYNRTVMAVPGRACDTASEGTNTLLKTNKARMVCSASDILTELGWEQTAQKPRQERDLSMLGRDAAGLYACLPEGEAVGIEHLGTITGLSAGELAPVLLE
jgi:DNA processing protein